MGKKVYWSHFSTAGWGIVEANLEQILGQAELSPTLAKISPPPAPPLSEDSIPKTPRRVYPVETYSPYSSLLPRGVSPVGAVDARGVSLGAQTIGFDHLDLHRYSLGASFSSQIQSGSIYALYSNRTLGLNLSFSGGYLATVTGSNSVFTQFSRQAFFTGSMAFPVVRTYSEWVPSLSFNLGRTFNYLTDSVQMVSQPGGGPIVASVDAGLVFSNQETSRLAVTSEGGRYSVLGSRYYFLPDSPVWKLYLQDREYIRIGSHTIISPSVAAEWTSAQSAIYPWANALLQGRSAVSVANSVPGDSLTFLGIRGYPNYLFYGRAAIRPMLDFRIPISRVFGGIGTQRFFFDNLYAVAFAESSVLWGRGAPEILPSVGGGIRLSSEVFYIPVTWGIEFHQGFNRSLGGTSDLFFNVLASGLTF
jgi:hypothetical protein